MKNKQFDKVISPRKNTARPSPKNKVDSVLDIFITVHIKNESFKIYCGDGKQKVKWLMDVALHKYDKHFALEAGKHIL